MKLVNLLKKNTKMNIYFKMQILIYELIIYKIH